MSNCDLTKLEAYITGTLPPGEETAYDMHLQTCFSCQAALLSATKGAGVAARAATRWEVLPDQVDRRIRRIGAPRKTAFVLAGGGFAVAAALLIVFVSVGPREPTAVVASQPRVVVAKSALPASILATEPTTITVDNVRVRTAGVARLAIALKRGEIVVTPQFGIVDVTVPAGSTVKMELGSMMATVARRAVASLIGNQSELTAFIEAVTVLSGGRSANLPPGFKTKLTSFEVMPAGEDFFVLADHSDSGLRAITEAMKATVKAPKTDLLPPDLLAPLSRAHRSQRIEDILAAARACARKEHLGLVADLVRWMLTISPDFKEIATSDRKMLVLATLRDQGDWALAERLSSGFPELARWHRLAQTRHNAEVEPRCETLKNQLANIGTASSVEEKLVVAEAYMYFNNRSTEFQHELGIGGQIGREVGLDLAATDEQRAFGWHATAETVHYIEAGRAEALEAGLTALKLWRRPHWLVHYAARSTEVSSYDKRTAASIVIEGLSREQSFDSFNRAITLVHDLAENAADRKAEHDFIVWVAGLFWETPFALDVCLSRLAGWHESPESGRIAERLISLVGTWEEVGNDTRAVYCAMLWRQGERERADATFTSVPDDPAHTAGYFTQCGRTNEALDLYRRNNWFELGPVGIAHTLDALQTPNRLAAWRTALSTIEASPSDFSILDHVHALLAVAELSPTESATLISRAERLAPTILSPGFDRQRHIWVSEARIKALRGRASEARALLQNVLATDPSRGMRGDAARRIALTSSK